jgi:hypothetical protein
VPIIMLKYIRQNKVAIPLPDYFNPEARPNWISHFCTFNQLLTTTNTHFSPGTFFMALLRPYILSPCQGQFSIDISYSLFCFYLLSFLLVLFLLVTHKI